MASPEVRANLSIYSEVSCRNFIGYVDEVVGSFAGISFDDKGIEGRIVINNETWIIAEKANYLRTASSDDMIVYRPGQARNIGICGNPEEESTNGSTEGINDTSLTSISASPSQSFQARQ